MSTTAEEGGQERMSDSTLGECRCVVVGSVRSAASSGQKIQQHHRNNEKVAEISVAVGEWLAMVAKPKNHDGLEVIG